MRTAEQLINDLQQLQAANGVSSAGELVLEAGKATRGGSRFVGEGADQSVVEHVAKGGNIGPGGQFLPAPGVPGQIGGTKAGGGLALGMKALAEGTGSAGGYLVEPQVSAEVLGLVRARSAIMRMLPTVRPCLTTLSRASASR